MAADVPSILSLEGALTMADSGRFLDEGRALVSRSDVVADFSGVKECDSSALALLLEWRRLALKSGHVLSAKGLPDGLRSLAELYGITDILPPEVPSE